MDLKRSVLLVTREPGTESAVASALEAGEHMEPSGICRGLNDLANRLTANPFPAALIDIDPKPGEMLKELDPIVARFSKTRFVVLSKDLSNDLVLEAMQAGARHFLSHPSQRELRHRPFR